MDYKVSDPTSKKCNYLEHALWPVSGSIAPPLSFDIDKKPQTILLLYLLHPKSYGQADKG